jgi:uncharacterized membrane protein YhaH (DUF805 family)
MKKYFYSNGQDKEGPVTLEELKQKDIKPKTLIWYEGLDDWKEAGDVDELREVFELSPPPIESETNPTIDIETSEQVSDNETTSETIYAKQYAVKRMFSNPFSFKGRIRRSEYCISFIIAASIPTILKEFEPESQLAVVYLLIIPMYWFLFAQGTKRCHDLDKSGVWQIVPFYALWLMFAEAKSEINQYGRNPKA